MAVSPARAMNTPQPSDAQQTWHARLPFFYGWIIVILAFFSSFFGIGLTWAASIFAVPMREELGWGNSAFFFAVSLRGWMGIIITPFVGPYLDRKDAVRVLTFIGAMINVVSLVLLSAVEEEWQFVVLFGVVGGVAQACQAGLTVIVAKWFIRQRGFATTISTMGGGLAALLLPPLLIALDGAVGWRPSWTVVAFLALVFGTLPVIFLRRQPEDIGLLPDGDKARPAGERGALAAAAEEVSYTRAEAVRTSTFWILLAGMSVGALAANAIPSNIANMFTDRGLAFDVAASALVAYGIGSITAKFAWGWLANRVHLRKVMLLLTAYGMLVIPSVLLVPSSVGTPALAYGFLIGFYVGAYIPLHFLVWAVYFGRAHVGAISGVGRPLGSVLLSGGPFMMAFTRDVFGTYTAGLLICAGAVAIAFVCLCFVKPPTRSQGRRVTGTVAGTAEVAASG
jgi:predicted MFS family arabinose efflux permease